MASEKNFENRIKFFLKSNNCYFIKYWGGGEFTKAGVPDILACCNGRFLGIVEDGQFALDVLKYINDKVNEFKEEDGWLYAIYGTPAESLCGLQIEQFRKMYGVIENVSDRPYVSNSFHCHVTEDITPIQKQDLEGRFWDLCNGGKIQYVRYPIDYNKDAIRTLVKQRKTSQPLQRKS